MAATSAEQWVHNAISLISLLPPPIYYLFFSIALLRLRVPMGPVADFPQDHSFPLLGEEMLLSDGGIALRTPRPSQVSPWSQYHGDVATCPRHWVPTRLISDPPPAPEEV